MHEGSHIREWEDGRHHILFEVVMMLVRLASWPLVGWLIVLGSEVQRTDKLQEWPLIFTFHGNQPPFSQQWISWKLVETVLNTLLGIAARYKTGPPHFNTFYLQQSWQVNQSCFSNRNSVDGWNHIFLQMNLLSLFLVFFINFKILRPKKVKEV